MESIKQLKHDRLQKTAIDRLIDLIEFTQKFNGDNIHMVIYIASDIMEQLEGITINATKITLKEDPDLRPTTIHIKVEK